AWDQEVTTPYYYSTRFDESLIQTEFTPTERSGYFRFRFPHQKALVHLKNLHPGDLRTEKNNAISGNEEFKGKEPGQIMRAYFYGEFNAPLKATLERKDGKSRLTLQGSASLLEFRYGVSFISVEQAKKNLQSEIPSWDFDLVRNNAQKRWNKTLGQIEIKGGTEAQRRVFYTSLYRTYERMINVTEDGKYYSPYDHQVHQDPRPFYTDNWIWDLFHAHGPLHALLNPEMAADQIQSYVRMYEQSGWMPSFAVLWGDYPCMNGNHSAAWFADDWFKGIQNFDMPKALEGVRKNSLEATLLPWRNGPKCALDDFYNKQGYFPALPEGAKETEPLVFPLEDRQAVAVTLANSYDDWCIAQLARSAGNNNDYDLFMKRSQFYKNVWNVKEGCMWPKDANGKWIEGLDPKFGGGRGGRAYYDENNAYTYNWDVPHDEEGLFTLMGGHQAAEAKLDQLFREGLGRSKFEFFAKFPDASGLVGQFSMGNEPSFSIPYLYNQLGAPWKTEKRVRNLLDQWFNDDIHGIPGDEDGGGMTAWVVFSMIGFYPTTPGLPVYDWGSPVFDDLKIHLHNGKTIEIEAKNNSKNNKYIQSVKLNGKELDRSWFRHAEIANGAKFEIEMGNTPNQSWATTPRSLLPHSVKLNPESFTTLP
ncbi:MAG: GH92 family glycosyl hydrolase, partial [Verrucomicrobiota bacterium]